MKSNGGVHKGVKIGSDLFIAVIRKSGLSIKQVQREIKNSGFVIDQNHPDIVFSIGGDGTLFDAERRYPGVPKVLIRESRICNHCEDGTIRDALEKIGKCMYTIEPVMKLLLSTRIKSRCVQKICLNEFSIRNKLMTRALRFSVSVDNNPAQVVIGDGVVVATPFGSAAYFYSVCRQTFSSGIGVGFNNPTIRLKPLVISEKSKTIITILRHDALLASDNDPQIITIGQWSKIMIKKSSQVARLVRFIK